MRFLFHAMLGFALGIVGTGVAYGAVTHERATSEGAAGHPRSHSSVDQGVSVQAALDPPAPLLPRYGEQIAAGSSLVWKLGEGSDGARIELSRTPAFDESATHAFEVDGERLRLPGQWPAGAWYWRVRGRSDGVIGDRASPTWMLVIPEPQPVMQYDDG